MKKALVSGGAGFIGSHIAEMLLERKYKVTVLDNFSTGRFENLSHLRNCKLEVFKEDISDSAKIKKYFKGIDLVFHIAALADIVPSIQRPLDYYRSNVTGTVSMLETARLAGVKKFVYAASSSCYGIPDKFPTDEKCPINPQYPYALTKYLGEECVMHWGKVYNMPVIALRLFNVYGPRSRTSGTYGAVFGVFLAQKLAGKPFTVVGDGKQKRDFVFVSDVARAFIMAAESGVRGCALNVGTGSPQSVNTLVRLLGGKNVHIPKRPGEPAVTYADISLIKRKIGWKPEVPFEKGVGIILKNIEYWRSAPVWTSEKIANATKDWFRYLGKERV